MSYKNKRYYKKEKRISFAKETFFVQLTACGILILGLLVFMITSPTASEVRSYINEVITSRDFLQPSIIELVQNIAFIQQPQEVHTPQDFSIDEEVLEDLQWRREGVGG